MTRLDGPTPSDDLFLHQIVAPQGTVGTDQRWGERSFFSVPLTDTVLFEMGLRAYPQRALIEGYAVARKGDEQWNVRTGAELSYGDPLTISAGAIQSRIVEPGAKWHLRVDAPQHEVEVDLTFEARTAQFFCDPMHIERDGEVLVHNVTYFQSGRYTGWATIAGERFEVEGRAGLRDRSWGHRKRESAPARGLMTLIAIERPAGALLAWVYEKGDGTRTYTHGAWLDEDGGARHVEAVEHRYEFDPESGSLLRGELTIDGAAVEFEVNTAVHMSGAGHTEGRGRSGTLVPGEILADRWQVGAPAEARRRRAVDDYLSTFRVDGEPGHGIVEVARGTTAAYGEPPQADAE